MPVLKGRVENKVRARSRASSGRYPELPAGVLQQSSTRRPLLLKDPSFFDRIARDRTHLKPLSSHRIKIPNNQRHGADLLQAGAEAEAEEKISRCVFLPRSGRYSDAARRNFIEAHMNLKETRALFGDPVDVSGIRQPCSVAGEVNRSEINALFEDHALISAQGQARLLGEANEFDLVNLKRKFATIRNREE